MLISEEDVQLLTRTGLTQSQAYLYLALLKKGKTNAATLSRQTKTPRTETYRILNELQEIGLVEKQLLVPYVYQAIPLKFAAQALMIKKIKEYKETQKKINELLLKIEETEETHHETEPKIIINKGKQRLLQLLKTGQDNAKNSIDFISTTKRWCQLVGYGCDGWKEALNRGIIHRGILEETECETDFPDNAKELLKKPNIEIRVLKKASKTNYAIYDNKEVAFNYTPLKPLREAMTIWTNHPSLIAIFKEHFETLWEAAVKTEYHQLKKPKTVIQTS
jgi:sugar-specific transcriptional regulator TrmB